MATSDVPTPPSTLALWLDRILPGPMFALSLVYLALAAGVVHRLEEGYFTHFEAGAMMWCLVALWPIFALDALVRFFLTRGQYSRWTRFGILLAVLLFPWVRMGTRALADRQQVWLPRVGWQLVDRTLRRRMERFFSVPLIIFALMVLPVLALEHFWEEQVHQHFWLKLALDIATSLIWMAFALEFTLSISVAEKKLAYCVQNWIDVAVVALPVIDFLPILRMLRLARLAQLNQLGQLGRLYRLRGLMFKAWRAFLLLEMLSRLLGNYKERRLKKLKDMVAAQEIELEEMRQEIRELEQAIQKEKAAAVAQKPEMAAQQETTE
jgi:voltage-gated potassium channel